MHGTLDKILSDIRSLEPFPEVALRVLEIAEQEEVVPAELIAVIQTDPGLTAKVLRLCNSAYYGFQREIGSIQEAGNLLGVSALVNLVLTTTANRYFRKTRRSAADDRLWKSCMANALAARLIARPLAHVDKERAYTAGLLQNIGLLVLERFLEEDKDAVRAEVARGSDLLEAERCVLGLHHAEIGARLADHWGLPDVLVDTIRNHHTPRAASVDAQLTATIHLASSMTSALGLAGTLEDLAYLDDSEDALRITGLSQADLADLDQRLGVELARAEDLFAD